MKIITWDYEGKTNHEIECVPLWKWLMKKELR